MEHLLGLASVRVLNRRLAWFWYSRILLKKITLSFRAGEPVSEPGVFGSLEPEPFEKNQEPEPIGKKVRSRSR